MNERKKMLRVGAAFIALLLISGLVLMYKGNDAVGNTFFPKHTFERGKHIVLHHSIIVNAQQTFQ